ncbi:MAG: GNAT family N-acetyltransferase [Blastocatellia bacterium]
MNTTSKQEVVYRVNPAVTDDELNALFAVSWPDHECMDFRPVLSRSLSYVCAYVSEQLIGYVNVAWDGRFHAFLLDPTVHPAQRRRGIGRRLVEEAVALAGKRGVEWVHVDFDPHLRGFYSKCGFQPTEAGLIHIALTEPWKDRDATHR